MSKVQIQELEAVTTNSNLKVTPNGTGVLKVSGDTDGTLQLDDVKVKAPPASAAQDYSLILPETNIAADKYVQVDSITGSGATATGQLTYTSLATPSASPLNGANFTSGTVPSARYSIAGSNGAGFKLISYSQVSQPSIPYVLFTGLEENTTYRLTTKRMLTSSTSVYIHPLDSSNNNWTNSRYMNTITWSTRNKNRGGATSGYAQVFSNTGNTTSSCYSFVLDFNTGKNGTATSQQHAYMHLYGHGYDYNTNYQGYASFMDNYTQTRIYGLKVQAQSGNLGVGSKLMLYKFQES